jgi:hypothetical protein
MQGSLSSFSKEFRPMNRRTLMFGLMSLLSLTAVWAVLIQHHQLQSLRKQTRIVASISTPLPPTSAANESATSTASVGATADTSPELLRLRSEAGLLAARQRELLPLQTENEQLRARINAAGTNIGAALPPGYLRKSQARFVGYGTPDDTLQSFLWALHNRNLTNLLQALTPGSAKLLQSQTESMDSFLEQMQALVGMSITEREQLPDGGMALKVQVLPELPPANITFRNTNREWKMDLPR